MMLSAAGHARRLSRRVGVWVVGIRKKRSVVGCLKKRGGGRFYLPCFSTSSLALAATSDHFALRICAVDLKNDSKTAEALIKIKRCLAAAQISVEVTDIKVG